MYRGHDRDQWSRLSEMMSLVANCNRDPSEKPTPFTGRDFDPYTDEGELKKPKSRKPAPRFDKALNAAGIKNPNRKG
jgi:hypothetical protein